VLEEFAGWWWFLLDREVVESAYFLEGAEGRLVWLPPRREWAE
jgi:hypothetical protein